MRLFAFLPCYNEAPNIGALIEAWQQVTPGLKERGFDLQVVGIDDHSTDDTADLIAASPYPNVTLIRHEVNQGLGGGLNTAIGVFLDRGEAGDLMVLMDGDNTHDPKYVFGLLDQIDQGKDCVIASRYCRDSGVVGLAHHRETLSLLARAYYRMVLKVPGVADYTCGYRAYTYDIIKRLTDHFGPEPVAEKTFACMMELLYKLHLAGASFAESGFELRYDNKLGASKMRVANTVIASLTTAVRLRRTGGNKA